MCVADPVKIEMTGQWPFHYILPCLNFHDTFAQATQNATKPGRTYHLLRKIQTRSKSTRDTRTPGTGTLPVGLGFLYFLLYTDLMFTFLDVTTAAHAEFFSGNFQMPNITKLHLDSLTAVGKFINAPDNRLVFWEQLKFNNAICL